MTRRTAAAIFNAAIFPMIAGCQLIDTFTFMHPVPAQSEKSPPQTVYTPIGDLPPCLHNPTVVLSQPT
jgi:hypothetical protein